MQDGAAAEAQAEDEDDGFVELSPANPVKVLAEVTIHVVNIRGGSRKLSISMSKEFHANFEATTPRFNVAYHAKHKTFRIKHVINGQFEAYETQRGERQILRIPRLVGLYPEEKAKAVPVWEFEGNTLYLNVPLDWTKPKLALPAPEKEKAAEGGRPPPNPTTGPGGRAPNRLLTTRQ